MALKLEDIAGTAAGAAGHVPPPRRRLRAYSPPFALPGAVLVARRGMSSPSLTRPGATIPPSQAAARQATEDVAFGSALFFRPVPYKLALYRQRRPDVAIVGSSRAIQFV